MLETHLYAGNDNRVLRVFLWRKLAGQEPETPVRSRYLGGNVSLQVYVLVQGVRTLSKLHESTHGAGRGFNTLQIRQIATSNRIYPNA